MLQFLKGVFNIIIHRKSTRPIVITSLEVNANVLGGVGIALDDIIPAHGGHQVCKIFVTVILDEEVINNKDKGDDMCLVVEIILDKSQFDISCSSQAFDNVIVSKFTGLF